MNLLVLGLSLSSSWGNGHATTFRALLRGWQALGHRATFLERDAPWYAAHRDLPAPDFCGFALYGDVAGLLARHGAAIAQADAVLIGSFVPDGVAVIDAVARIARGPVCFYDIDTPVTLARLARGEEAYLAARQIPGFDAYFSFTGGPLLHRLEAQYGARRALPLYCSVEPERYRHTGAAPRWDLGYLGTYSADRQPVLERLLIEPARRLPHRRFVVAGPQYPEDIAWPPNVQRIAHLPPDAHAEFYSAQRHTLNVTRADMVAAGWSPSVRLFEAAAVGTPLLSDVWEGLEALLPDAVHLVRDAADVVAALEAPEDGARQAMAARARRIVLEGHTGQVRAGELAQALGSLAAPRPALAAGG
ncbi:CgeB family protein [Falsiroseomonas selenitidurans]|uniref:Glycosyltransferase n=1 Tax=Falsiroseomonas selenitidurans TaxID=2716335 RepID=A0ABX1E1H8_9PROT|nr:glycosyltransferase [Falsiroseomonas selenitidurans]NKC30540.1 glycosyltransferase [Falsiroseomonas selenitidurans]